MFKKLSPLSVLIAAAGTLSSWAQPMELYENFGFINSAEELPIDALSFANYGSIEVASALPFDTQNTLNFTNRGLMQGSVGFNFQHISSTGVRGPAQNFVNDRGAAIFANPPLLESDPAFLLIEAENVINHGRLNVGAGGLIRITGNNVDLFNSGLAITPVAGTGTVNSTNTFTPDSGLIDEYWGGVTNLIGDTSTILQLSGSTLSVRTPSHSVTNRFFDQLGISLSLQSPDAFVISNAITETNIVVQGIFAVMGHPTIQTDARFVPSPVTNEISTAILEMAVPIPNEVTGELDIFRLYLSDTLPWHTNHFTLRNINDITQRPFTYELSRLQPPSWQGGMLAQDIDVTPELLWGPTFSNTLSTNLYAAYAANVNNLVTPAILIPESSAAVGPGRVEINAKNLNMENTRFRGEGLISINAENLISSRGAVVDSQNLSFNLASTDGPLNVQDLAKTSINRFAGQLRAFSMVWTNQSGSITEEVVEDATAGTSTTNMVTNVIDIFHHIMVVDGTRMRTSVEVATHDFVADVQAGEEVVIHDSMNVLESFSSNAERFTNEGEIFLSQNIPNFGSANTPNVKSFTNNGSLTIAEVADFGYDRTNGLDSFVNSGSLSAFSPRFKTEYFENSGDITGGGRVVLQATTAKLEGGITRAGRDLDIEGVDVKLRNYEIATALRLGLNVSGTLTDSGPSANNRITVGDGFVMQQVPSAGDLLGTAISSRIPRFLRVDHTWGGTDPDPSGDNPELWVGGFKNNLALGRLELSGPAGSQARFLATGESGALFVEFLEFSDSFILTGADSLVIKDGMTLYFADSNLPVEVLNGAHGNKLRWVREYAGPNSSVDVALATEGRTVRVNRGLRESLVIDSDGDGTANGIDLSPFDGVTLSDLGVQVGKSSIVTSLSWLAAADTEYRVEYRVGLGDEAWQFLQDIANNSSERRLITVNDEVPKETGQPSRYYRVTYLP